MILQGVAVKGVHTTDSNKQRVKLKDNLPNKLAHLMKRFDDRITHDNPNFVERYIELECHLLIHFRFRDGMEYIASFQHANGYHRREKFAKVRNGLALQSSRDFCPLTWRDTSAAIRRSNSKQQAMLVDVVKAVKTPERVIPSFVWFDTLNRVNRILPHALYFSSEKGRCVFRGTLDDGKTGFAARSVACHKNKVIGEVVKGTSEVVKNVPADGNNIIGDIPNADEVVADLSLVRIALNFDYIWACPGVKKGCASGLQILDVLFGPLDFYED